MRPEGKRRIKKPTQARSRFMVEQILEAAAQVFAEAGYAAATTNRIAERAGVSIGSLYRYYPDKDSILLELVGHHLQQGIAMLVDVSGRVDLPKVDLDVFIKEVVRAVLELHTKNPRLHYVLLSEAVWSSEVIAELHQIEDRVAMVLAWALTNHPQVRVRDPAQAAYIIVHLVKDLAHEYVVHPPTAVSEEDFIAEVTHLLRCYLTTAGPSRPDKKSVREASESDCSE